MTFRRVLQFFVLSFTALTAGQGTGPLVPYLCPDITEDGPWVPYWPALTPNATVTADSFTFQQDQNQFQGNFTMAVNNTFSCTNDAVTDIQILSPYMWPISFSYEDPWNFQFSVDIPLPQITPGPDTMLCLPRIVVNFNLGQGCCSEQVNEINNYAVGCGPGTQFPWFCYPQDSVHFPNCA
jgi:hypothetical protein